MKQSASSQILNRLAFALLWLFVFSIPLKQIIEYPILATVSQALGIAAVVTAGAIVALRRQIRFLEPVHMAMAVLILWATVTLCWSVASSLTVARISTYLQLFVLVLLVWELCRKEQDILKILQAFVLGTIPPAISILIGFVPGDDTLAKRAALGFDFEGLAFLLAASLPVSYYLILRETTPISALYRLHMGITLCAVLSGGSAATMIATVVGLTVICWTFHALPVRTRVRAFGTTALLGIGVYVVIPSALIQHLSEESHRGGLALTRTLQYSINGLQSLPVGGLGAGALVDAATPVKSSFTMFAETGVMGILCCVLLLGLFTRTARQLPGIHKSFWITMLAVWSVGICTPGWEYSQPAWLLLGLLAAHGGCLERRPRVNESSQREGCYIPQPVGVLS
jgi:hypothetical protein